MADKLKVAIVQASPIFMNLEASLAKAVALIEQAVNHGAKIITFGETWLAGYPVWLDFFQNAALWNHEPTKEVFAKLRRNSVVVPGAETKTLGEIAAKFSIVLVIGINERSNTARATERFIIHCSLSARMESCLIIIASSFRLTPSE